MDRSEERTISQDAAANAVSTNIQNAGLQCNEKGVKQTIGNCVQALMYDKRFSGNIKYNLFTQQIDIVDGFYWKRSELSITDNDFNNILLYMESNYGLTNERKLQSAIDIVAHQNEYHPIRDTLNQLTYNGSGYIENLFPRYLGVKKSDYCTEVTKIFMMGAIERVFNPGCKNDTMLCIVGGQGIGKSSLFRFLAIKDEWFSDDLRKIDSEKCFEKMLGNWIIEMSEMLAMKTSKNIEELKAFISRQYDTYRTPYSKYAQTHKRQCVLCGTTNDLSFLPNDRTGNRRFLPIVADQQAVIHPLSNEKETRKFVNSAWAEAMDIYRSGQYKRILSDGFQEYLKELHSDLMPEDTKVGVIQEWLDNFQGKKVCSLMLYKEALDNQFDDPTNSELKEINEIMNFKIEGWKKSTQHRFKVYGMQRSWERVEQDCRQEMKQGFENIDDNYHQEVLPFEK